MQAVLALEDGRLFRGKAYGAIAERVGEVVFNTSMTGYQEIFTDPSYAGQIVVLTNPHMGTMERVRAMRSRRGRTSRGWWCGSFRR